MLKRRCGVSGEAMHGSYAKTKTQEYEEYWASEFYENVMAVILGEQSVIDFSSEYIAEEWDDAAPAFMFYDTYVYCINKGIFKN